MDEQSKRMDDEDLKAYPKECTRHVVIWRKQMDNGDPARFPGKFELGCDWRGGSGEIIQLFDSIADAVVYCQQNNIVPDLRTFDDIDGGYEAKVLWCHCWQVCLQHE